MKTHLFLLSTLALLAPTALCQAQAYKTKIITLSLSVDTPQAYFMSDGKAEPYAAERSGLGNPLPYSGSSDFILRSSPEEFAAKPPLPAPLASVRLPQNAALVLIVSSASDKELKLKAYDISTQGFGAGDYRFFNFTDKDTVILMGKSRIALKAGADRIVTNAVAKDKATDITIQIAHIEGGEATRVYASSWGYQPVKRHFVLLFNGSHPSRPVAIRRYSDRPE